MPLTATPDTATLPAVFRELIKREMDRRGMTARDLAEKSGVQHPRLYVWLKGGTTPGGREVTMTILHLEKVLKALGITLTAKPSRRRAAK